MLRPLLHFTDTATGEKAVVRADLVLAFTPTSYDHDHTNIFCMREDRYFVATEDVEELTARLKKAFEEAPRHA